MDDEKEYYNYFDEEIMDLDKQKFVIYIFRNTFIDVSEKKLPEGPENSNDNFDKPIERLINFLKKNLYSDENNEKYIKMLNDYNDQQENEESKINYDYSLKNYANIVLYIKKNTLNNDKIFINVLEFCFIVAFQSFFKLEKEYTINLFLFDNFNKIRKPNLFKTLEKNGIPLELLKDGKLKDYYKNCPETDTFDEKKVKYKIDNKEIEPLDLFKNYYKKTLESIKKNGPIQEPNIEFLEKIEQLEDDKFYLKGIIPLIYIGQYIKIQKNNYIAQSINPMTKELKDYLDKSLNLMYIYPKSSYIDLFITSFLVYKIVNSPFIGLKNNKYNLDFNQAYINISNSIIISSAIKFDQRIHTVTFTQNKIGETGMFEAALNFSLNKKIEVIDFSQMNITTEHLQYFLNGFVTDSIENILELNLSNNTYFKNNIETGIYLAKIIGKFKKLKTLNLNKCKLKNSINPIFIELDNLYSKGNYELENLLISMNEMTQNAIYSLGKLVRNKKCQLVVLSCGYSNFHNDAGRYFLKSLAENDILQELYLYQAQLEDSDYEIIKYVIINSKLNILSLYKNNIKNFDTILKLFSLTSILKIDKNVEPQNVLYSLDLSDNPINQKTILNIDIALLTYICKKTGLSMFDLAHIIHGNTNEIKEVKDAEIIDSTLNASSTFDTSQNSSKSTNNSSNIKYVRIIEESNFDGTKVNNFDEEENNLLNYIYKVQDQFKMIY